MSDPLFLSRVLADLDRRRPRVLAELHPDLRRLVERLTDELGGRLTPYTGYRGPEEQERARRAGYSAARFGQSPHNYQPSLACDLVLDPRYVSVRAHPRDPRWPDLWDDQSPEAQRAWADLHEAALDLGLDRVRVRGRPDRPHVQLPGWLRLARSARWEVAPVRLASVVRTPLLR